MAEDNIISKPAAAILDCGSHSSNLSRFLMTFFPPSPLPLFPCHPFAAPFALFDSYTLAISGTKRLPPLHITFMGTAEQTPLIL